MKKNSNSPMKKEPRAKRAKAQRPVQRETKEVLAELVEKLRGKLEGRATPASRFAATGISRNCRRRRLSVSEDGSNPLNADADVTLSTAPAPSKSIKLVFGPYTLLERIGEGGMGEVWLAEQKEPVRRRVALKLIKAGMDSKDIVARFESERQALALMDHPNIAKVFDGGSTPDGHPYFVMEYVAGMPITRIATSISSPRGNGLSSSFTFARGCNTLIRKRSSIAI